MMLQSRLDSELFRLKSLLEASPVKHIDPDNITQESLHKGLLYLSDRSSKPLGQRKHHEKELRRCIADVLLLLDGIDINKTDQKSTFQEKIE